jgi:DNA helicase II / ATP-dependent DNA helicase PcrA
MSVAPRPSEVRLDELPYTEAPPEVVAAMRGRVPTVQQWRALSHGLEPCCIIAGAGSGKTAVITARVVYLALVAAGRLGADHQGALPSEVLCLTFTNKAAAELAARVRDATAALGLAEGEEATVLTYHAFASRLLEDHGLRQKLEPGARLLSEAQQWQLAGTLLEGRELEHLEVRSLGHVIGQILQLADECSNHLVDPEAVIEHSRELAGRREIRSAADRDMLVTAERRAELATLVADYQRRKRELGVIDHGDQIRLAVDLVEGHPEVSREFRERFRVVLLDEYQDTNVAQARMLRALCPPGFPVTAVGDPDQNIYGWRGASLRNILRFATDFPAADGPAGGRPLYVNFRSGSRILEVANRVISDVPEDRRAAEKILRPDPERGEGRVSSFVAGDERSEGHRIARLIQEHVAARPRINGEPAWQDVAVLCRKRRLFSAIAEVLREEGIPVEVVDLGGLLRLPEVVDVVAWLRLLDDPARNIALARIVMGPRWRVGYRDLAALAQWALERNQELRSTLPTKDERPGDIGFALSEALAHLDDPEMKRLSPEGRDRLAAFREELAALREATSLPLGDLVAEVVERSGAMRELEAAGTPAAAGARRNLLNLIDHVAAFAPVEGEATLSTLVAYLDAAEETEDDLEPAQPSEANTVKLLTVHKAKGLEWPVVFVPGLATGPRSGIFPDLKRQAVPVTRPDVLPFELRGDADVLPAYEGNIKAFRDALGERALEDERRLCYVALTRARDVLVASSAAWYEGPADPFGPSVFLHEIRGEPACESLLDDEVPEENPLVELRRRRAGTWPPPARAPDADDLFPQGWHAAAVDAASGSGASEPARASRSLAASLGPEVAAAFDARLAADAERIALIRERTRVDLPVPAPASLSVTGLIDYEACPQRYYWSEIRPLPRRPNQAARLGSEVHAWIERTSRGQATLDLDDLPDLAPEERFADPAKEAALKDAFRASRFAGQVPLYAERPFALWLGGVVVRGKIDAIFGRPDGPWEVVDYKTGRAPSGDDPTLGLQLDVYALACQEIWRKRPQDLRLTYFYLATSEEISVPAGDPDDTRRRVTRAAAAIAAGRFDPAPAPHCRWCDFQAFCPAGRQWVAEHPEEAAG